MDQSLAIHPVRLSGNPPPKNEPRTAGRNPDGTPKHPTPTTDNGNPPPKNEP